jgi:hypothetical protein
MNVILGSALGLVAGGAAAGIAAGVVLVVTGGAMGMSVLAATATIGAVAGTLAALELDPAGKARGEASGR